jgi:DNA polymerase, archaea type
MKMQFTPIDYSSFDFNGKNIIKIIGRNEKNQRICVIDDCDIYLWAILKPNLNASQIDKLLHEIEKIQLDIKGRKTKVEKVELHEKNFLGKKVDAIKVFATNYKDLPEIASRIPPEHIEKRRNYDLGFITHYIIEKELSPLNNYEIEGDILTFQEDFGGIKDIDVDFCLKLNSFKKNPKTLFNPKVLAYDIETDEIQIGKGKILMLSLFSENFKKVITWKKSKEKKPSYVEYVENEKELIEKFCECVKEVSPDFLVGYYSDGFDLPYLRERAKKNQIKLSLGLDGSQPVFSRGKTLTGRIEGLTHIDLLKFVKTAYSQYMQSETLSLNEVAKEFLSDTKKNFELKHSSKLTEKEWTQFYEYNLQDSDLTFRLFNKFWPDLREFTRTVQEPPFEVSRAGLSKYTESYILHNLKKFNEIPEKRPTNEEITQRRNLGPVQGAFVLEPKPGLYEKIAMFDFTSMHTSIIISYNISKGTLLEEKKKDCYTSPPIMDKGKKTFYHFEKTPGFFPELMKEIFKLRKKFKAEYKKTPNPITKARSNAFKVLSASAHGYVGFFGARYYSHESSKAILAFVRKLNQETIKKAEQEGYTPVYGDTDSIAFLMGKKSEKEIKEFLKKLNSELPGVMELELDGIYERGLWVTTRSGKTGAKKKYALIDKKENIKIRGFETVRRDWCALSRKVQSTILEKILKEGDEKESLKYLKEIIKKIKERKIDKKELIIKTQLKKPLSEYVAQGPHVIAAKRRKELKIPTSQGNIIEYYIAETKTNSKLVRDKVKLPEEEGIYEIEYYLKKQILPAVENIFHLFGINISEIIDGKKQTTLGDF